MFVSFRPGFRGWLIPLAAAAFFCIPDNAFAQFGGQFGQFGGQFGQLGGQLGQLGGGGGGAAGGGQQAPQIQRATNQLPNPVNYWQYSQVTGVKPIIGTVRIYNTFGTLGIQNGGGLGQGFNSGQQGGGFGGGFGGLGGGGGGGAGGNIPGIGATQGDDPPQGTLLHVQYAQLFFPNQQQINQGAFGGNQNQFGGGGFGGGFGGGGFGGFPGGGGKFGGFNGGFGF